MKGSERKSYFFADWKSGAVPPEGWDVADAVDDGWTRENYDEFLRFSISDTLPSFDMLPSAANENPPNRGAQFTFADWKSGVVPPEGWDVADAVADGWTRDDVDTMMRLAICDTPPPYDLTPASADPPAQTRQEAIVAQVATPCGHDPIGAIRQLPHVLEVEFDSEVFLADHLSRRMQVACGDVVRAEGQFWCWGPTAWSAIPDQVLRLAVHKFDMSATSSGRKNVRIGKRTIDGVLTELGTILSRPDFFAEPTVGLNARNTVIEVDGSGRVMERPHSPTDRFRWTIPAEFHFHTAMSPPVGSMLHRLLTGSFKGDADADQKVDLVGEILGSAAFGQATRLPQPKAFVFLGEKANNGKSTIAGLLRCLLPEGAVSAVPLSAFEDERRIVGLAGKAANIADELSAQAIAGEAFKAAVTGNVMQGRDLYKSALTFVPQALHLFTTNVLPRFNGGLDRGLQRRLVVVGFNRSIPTHEVVPDILDRIRRDELDLLLGFAIAGMQRLTRNQGYSIPPSSLEALNGWLRLDPVNEWVEECLVPTTEEPAGGWYQTSQLHAAFKAWAIERGHQDRHLPNVNTFGQRLRQTPGIDFKRRARGMFVSGVMLKATHAGDW